MSNGMVLPSFSGIEFTIGSIMGRLFRASEGEKVYFCCTAPDSVQSFTMNAYFYRINDAVFLCNVSEADENVLVLSTARNGNILPQTILIPGSCEYNVTEYFFQCAQLNIDFLSLTEGVLRNDRELPNSCDMALTLWASAHNIPVNGGFIPVSGFLKVYLGDDYVIIHAEQRRFINLLFLSVEGNMTVTLENIHGNGSSEPFRVPLPCNLIGQGVANVSLCCEIGGFALLS